jgi:hypothetical protein
MAKLSEFVTLAIILKNGLKANNLQNRGAADQRAQLTNTHHANLPTNPPTLSQENTLAQVGK